MRLVCCADDGCRDYYDDPAHAHELQGVDKDKYVAGEPWMSGAVVCFVGMAAGRVACGTMPCGLSLWGRQATASSREGRHTSVVLQVVFVLCVRLRVCGSDEDRAGTQVLPVRTGALITVRGRPGVDKHPEGRIEPQPCWSDFGGGRSCVWHHCCSGSLVRVLQHAAFGRCSPCVPWGL